MATIVDHPHGRDARRRRVHALLAAGRGPSFAIAIAAPLLLALGVWGMADAVDVTAHALLAFAVQSPVSA